MSNFNLKMVAIIAMLMDHIGAILFAGTQFEVYFRIVGRIAFPIFCFLVVEGYFHTKNVQKYLRRLGLFAIISEVPYDLAFSSFDNLTDSLLKQNVFFTLYVGLFVIMIMNRITKKYQHNVFLQNILNALAVIAGGYVTILIGSDYNIIGILLIVCFYLFRGKKTIIAFCVLLLNFELSNMIQMFAVFSMLFIWYYNGEKGKTMNKYIFYVFYPAHLLILVGIKALIG